MLYSIHLDSLILKETEEQVKKILDSDYSKVEIDEMVDGLDIHRGSKKELKKTLKKFPTLFGGGLGKLKGKKAIIKLKKVISHMWEVFILYQKHMKNQPRRK